MLKDLSVFVTDKCNLRCSYCGMSKGETMLPVSTLRTLLEGKNYGYGVILGGEPLLHPYIWRIVDVVQEHCGEVKFLTNGILATVPIFERLKSLGLTLGLSIDGDSSLKTVASLPAMFQAVRMGLPVSFNVTVSDTRRAMDTIRFLLPYAHEVNVGFLMESPGSFMGTPDDVQVTGDMDAFIKEYEKLYALNAQKMFVSPETMRSFRYCTAWRCSNEYADVILPGGEVRSCCMWSGTRSACPGCKSLCDMELDRRHA